MRRPIVFCLVGVTVSIGIGHAAETYRNTKYGFSAEVPTDVKLCREPPPNPDHGPRLLLDPSLSCEAPSDAEPSVHVNTSIQAAIGAWRVPMISLEPRHRIA